MLRFVRPSVCLSHYLILFRLQDGDMRALPFQTHSMGGQHGRLCRLPNTIGGDTARYLVCSQMHNKSQLDVTASEQDPQGSISTFSVVVVSESI